MKRRGQYILTRSRKRRRGGYIPLFLFLVLVSGGWFWWHLYFAPNAQPPRLDTRKPAVQQADLQKPVVQKLEPSPSPAPVVSTNAFPRAPRYVFETQVALDRLHISAGSIDGVAGSQTRAALLAFQRDHGLAETGALDAETRAALQITTSPLTTYTVSSNNIARLQPVGKTWLEKSQQTNLYYETILELVAEQSHAHPNLIKRLNPNVNWTNVAPGTVVHVPDVSSPQIKAKAAFVIISLGGRTFDAYDAETNLLAHFPCSIAQRVEKRPVGELHVQDIAHPANYTFDPETFPESPEAQQLKGKLIIPPGPNNPVGTTWISLDKPGYGMHGTPKPEDVGRTESHGCFRLANWNAEFLLKLVWIGLPVYVEP